MGVVANTKMSLTPFSLFHTVAPPCENVKSENFSVIVAYLLPLSHSQQRVVQGVQPFASNFNERCKSTTLTLKWVRIIADGGVGNMTERWLICDDPSLLRLSNIGRGA